MLGNKIRLKSCAFWDIGLLHSLDYFALDVSLQGLYHSAFNNVLQLVVFELLQNVLEEPYNRISVTNMVKFTLKSRLVTWQVC